MEVPEIFKSQWKQCNGGISGTIVSSGDLSRLMLGALKSLLTLTQPSWVLAVNEKINQESI